MIEIYHWQINKIRDEGAKHMAEALAINNTLITLYLEVRLIYETEKKMKILLKFNIHRAIELEMKEQINWSKI